MSQQLGAMASLPEDPGSLASTHTEICNRPAAAPVPGTQQGHCIRMVHRHACRPNTIDNKNLKFISVDDDENFLQRDCLKLTIIHFKQVLAGF